MLPQLAVSFIAIRKRESNAYCSAHCKANGSADYSACSRTMESTSCYAGNC